MLLCNHCIVKNNNNQPALGVWLANTFYSCIVHIVTEKLLCVIQTKSIAVFTIRAEKNSLHSLTYGLKLKWDSSIASCCCCCWLYLPCTAFTTTDVYYVTAHDAAGHEQSCPPNQIICHKLSYILLLPA